MKIPRSYIENYSAALNTVSERSREALIDALSNIDYTADIADVRNAVIAVMQPACGASTTVAARLAADFYDGLRLQFGIDDGYKASIETMREPEATDGAVRAFVQDLVDDKPIDQFIGKCADRIDAETRRAANECIAFNAQKDPEKPRWARVPVVTPTIYKPWSKERGVTHNAYLAQHGTCQFCMMLASRGFVYHSEELASHAHPGCDCRVIPSWDKEKAAIEGYDPKEYYEKWKHPEKFKSQPESDGLEFIPSSSSSKVKPAAERKAIYDRYQEINKESSKLRRQMMTASGDEKERLKNELQKLEDDARKQLAKLTKGEQLLEHARVWPAGDYIAPEKWNKKPSHDEVVAMLGGGDRTTGSCSSLAFAYFGNMGGSVVRDFRGGSSCNFFAKYGSIKEVGGIDGANTVIEKNRSAFKASEQVFKHAQEGKKYYFTAGSHAAVVEKRDGTMYYLELQTQNMNGWHVLDNAALKRRFGCTKTRTIAGMKVEQDAFLIDGETLSSSEEFAELMGFINTPEDKQKKGVGGGAK